MRRVTSLVALAACALATQALAVPPTEFTVQGVLRNGAGTLQSQPITITVNLFDAETGGTKLAGPYTQSNVPVANGLFSYTFSDAALPGILAAATSVWLEVTAGSDVFPRQKSSSTFYAAQAHDAFRLGGVVGTGYQRALDTPDCGVGKHIQGISDGGTVTCVADPTAGDGLTLTGTQFSVSFAGTGTATTAARSDHTHTTTMSCTQMSASVNGNGSTPATLTVGCTSGGTLTGGGCYSTTGSITRSQQWICPTRICLCPIGSYCGPTWQCTSSSASTAEVLTGYAMCCTTTVP
jgi:hypothetical protein